MTLREAYQCIPEQITWTSFRGHRCVRIINCTFLLLLFFLDSCPQYFKLKSCDIHGNDQAQQDQALCGSGVSLRGICNKYFLVLPLNVSHLSLCSSCFILVPLERLCLSAINEFQLLFTLGKQNIATAEL